MLISLNDYKIKKEGILFKCIQTLNAEVKQNKANTIMFHVNNSEIICIDMTYSIVL